MTEPTFSALQDYLDAAVADRARELGETARTTRPVFDNLSARLTELAAEHPQDSYDWEVLTAASEAVLALTELAEVVAEMAELDNQPAIPEG
jgi:hypothetical protein